MEQLRQQAQALVPAVAASLSVDRIVRAARKFKVSTGLGVDLWGFRDIANSSPEALAALLEILRDSVLRVAWPWQAMVAVMRRLGKKGGGSRTIALVPSLYRLLLAMVAVDARCWDADAAEEGDSALQGGLDVGRGGRTPPAHGARSHASPGPGRGALGWRQVL